MVERQPEQARLGEGEADVPDTGGPQPRHGIGDRIAGGLQRVEPGLHGRGQGVEGPAG